MLCTRMDKGVQRDEAPLPRVWGCPPIPFFSWVGVRAHGNAPSQRTRQGVENDRVGGAQPTLRLDSRLRGNDRRVVEYFPHLFLDSL
jgi:hypothetical protein